MWSDVAGVALGTDERRAKEGAKEEKGEDMMFELVVAKRTHGHHPMDPDGPPLPANRRTHVPP